jgi:hypothetical protein
LFIRCTDLRDNFLHLAAPRPETLEQIILGPFIPRIFPASFRRRWRGACSSPSKSAANRPI